MKRVIQFLALSMVLILPVLPAQSAHTTVPQAEPAIETTCPEIVQRAWSNIDSLCHAIGRNEACYGHVLLDAQPQPGVMRFSFDREGQTVNVADLRSLRLSTMDLLNGTWGVALLQIQANLPAVATGENVSLLLFGDVAIENAVPTLPLVDVTPRSPLNTINVRYRPTTQSPIVGLVEPDEVVTATGQLAGGSWLRINLPERSISGWVYAPLLASVDGTSLDTLREVDPASTYYGPMQAFYFQSGGQDAMCPEAPNSGILIQTPEGVAEVTLLINEVDIQLGSTVYFQAEPGDQMTVSVVEGRARVTVDGESQTAFAGTQVEVPLDGSGKPSGPPTPPRPYDMANLLGLPVDLMETPVQIAEPLTEEEIELAVTQEAAADGEDSGHPNPSAGDAPPGLVDNPGLVDDMPPGQNGTPPGQAKKDKD